MLKNVVTLGVIVALMVAMTANIAGAQPGNGKGKGQTKCSVVHAPNGKTLTIGAPAVPAHFAHGDELADGEEDEACEEAAGGGGGTTPTCDLAGTDVLVEDVDEDTIIDTGDKLTVVAERDFEIGPEWSLLLTDNTMGAPEVPINQDNATIAVVADQLVVTLTDDLSAPLTTDGLEVLESEGIACEPLVTTTGTLATTRSGDLALKTSSGKTLKLSAKTNKAEKRLKALAKKDAKVQVKGKKSGSTLEVASLKSAKGRRG